jgi:hypothetical protein
VGDDRATSATATAKEWGVSVRTVSNAAQKFKIDMKRDTARVSEL